MKTKWASSFAKELRGIQPGLQIQDRPEWNRALQREWLRCGAAEERDLDVPVEGGGDVFGFGVVEFADDDKAAANYAKHSVSFDEAKSVFDDPLFVDFYDPDHSTDEHRYIIIGESQRRRLLIVSYTEAPTAMRIISARELTRAERNEYEEG